MKLLVFLALCPFIFVHPLFARTWTDTQGRTIEADILSADETQVIVKLKGKEVPILLDKLSDVDKKFAAEWLEEHPADAAKENTTDAAATAGELTFLGKPLPRGQVTSFEAPLSEKAAKEFKSAKPVPTKLKITLAVPQNFDPAKPQRVVWVSGAINSPAERTSGNAGAINNYASVALKEGWVVITADTDLGNPRLEDDQDDKGGDLAVHTQAIEALSAEWPQFKTWQFVCSGMSGGAKATFPRAGQLIASDLNVIGMFLGGCNVDRTEGARKETRCSRGDLRKINVWISNGKADNISNMGHAEALKKSMSSTFGEVELMPFDGGHEVKPEEFTKALKWFTTEADK